MNKEEILKQAKEIMDEFSKVHDEDVGEIGVERIEDRRDGMVRDSDPDFIERFFDNAPKKKERYLAMEKKKW